MTKKKTYTKKEQILFYSKRFLKAFVPLALVIISLSNLEPKSFVIMFVAPLLMTLEKWMRVQGWYKL